MAVRKLLALIGAIAFPIAGFVAIAPALRGPRAPSTGAAVLDGVRVLADRDAGDVGRRARRRRLALDAF